MGRFTLILKFLLAFINLAPAYQEVTPSQLLYQSDINAIAESQAAFTTDLYKEIAKKSDGNIIFSPFSVGAAMTMVYIGSGGRTKSQIRSALSLPQDLNVCKNGFANVLTELKNDNTNYTLKITNRVFVADHLELVEDYSNDLSTYFGSIPHFVDFSQSEESRQFVNQLIENDTNSKIKELLLVGDISGFTRLILTNALYFNASWSVPLYPSPEKKAFWTSPETFVDVDTMQGIDYFQYKHDDFLKSSILKLDYKGERISMIFVLPDERNGLPELEEKLSANLVKNLNNGLSYDYVSLFLPKFKIEIRTSMEKTLKSLGIIDAFGKGANFERIFKTSQIYITGVKHKAYLKVDEEGSEAAAATAIVMATWVDRIDIPNTRKYFHADHPFLFFIKDSKTNQVLFTGRVKNPTEQE